MTNEWQEFLSYTEKLTYSATGKHDLSYLGRFSFKTITDFEGLGRILTIVARGYLFHNRNGEKIKENSYTRIEYARNALCAWCSLPYKNESTPCVCCNELHNDFPELVNSKGEGWYYRHIQDIIKFVKKNPNLTSKNAQNTIDGVSKGFKKEWKNKVKQLQVPIFELNTKASWGLRFDDIIADALELGPLRTEEYTLSDEKLQTIESIDLNGAPFDVVCDVVAFYEANKSPDSEWVVLPVSAFDCYYGNTNFSKKWLSKIPKDILARELSSGLCRVRIKL